VAISVNGVERSISLFLREDGARDRRESRETRRDDAMRTCPCEMAALGLLNKQPTASPPVLHHAVRERSDFAVVYRVHAAKPIRLEIALDQGQAPDALIIPPGIHSPKFLEFQFG
jgi:hypothetical protein